MIDLILLLWYFLAAQPPERLGAMLPWHLLALLASLGLLSAFGIHFLMGHVAGFYRRRERIARWVSLPSLLMLLISVQLLLGAYLLGIHGSRLVSLNQTDSVVNTLGANLLEPAFENPALAGASQGEIAKSHLKAAFKASTENRYREALAKKIVPPEKLTPSAQAGGGKGNRQRYPLGERILVQVGMRWITAPHETWWAPLNPGGAEKRKAERHGEPEAKADQGNGFFLPVFLGGLLGDLTDDVKLSRANWEHVAGTRFVEEYLQPVMMEYLAYFAMALALAVLLIDMLFFLALGRIKRIGLPKAEKAAAQVAAEAGESMKGEAKVDKGAVKSLPEPGGDGGTETGAEATAKSLPEPGVKSGEKTGVETSALAPANSPPETGVRTGEKTGVETTFVASKKVSDEISEAFPRTAGAAAPTEPGAAFPADQGGGALPSPSGGGGAGTPKGESSPQSAESKAGEEAPGALLMDKEQKNPEPAGIVKK